MTYLYDGYIYTYKLKLKKKWHLKSFNGLVYFITYNIFFSHIPYIRFYYYRYFLENLLPTD